MRQVLHLNFRRHFLAFLRWRRFRARGFYALLTLLEHLEPRLQLRDFVLLLAVLAVQSLDFGAVLVVVWGVCAFRPRHDPIGLQELFTPIAKLEDNGRCLANGRNMKRPSRPGYSIALRTEGNMLTQRTLLTHVFLRELARTRKYGLLGREDGDEFDSRDFETNGPDFAEGRFLWSLVCFVVSLCRRRWRCRRGW
ncbi:hypothetical protein EXIGLDRAFT_731828 [Exidia glandulosa HHB12029]|uniref:Uncharacterized protein n=1 Tax=Exidia glandulosa HHB12029 TaxID=1314781 RepID=A0A165KWP1_EXIGL|nr:hypothetical protein EXIGLDRAFT_731828 [Exidia glandulosa HHB12029]